MNIGRLNRRITFLVPTTAVDDAGGQVLTYTESKEVWATVRPVSAREQIESAQVAAIFDTVFTVRYEVTFDQTYRIQYGGREFDITGFREIGMREGWEITGRARR